MTEENTKLRQQIDIQEDIVTVNNTEIDKLKKKIRRYLASGWWFSPESSGFLHQKN
jgi:hypothetical protein